MCRMPTMIWPPKRTPLLLAIASIAVLLLFTGIVLLLLQNKGFGTRKGLAESVPAEQTQVFLTNMTADRWQAAAAILKDLPSMPDTSAVEAALVTVPSGKQIWVTMDAKGMIIIDPDVTALTADHPSLSQTPLFRTLSTDDAGAAQAFVRSLQLQSWHLTTTPEAIGVSWSGSGVKLSVAGITPSVTNEWMPAQTMLDASTAVNDPSLAWQALAAVMPPDRLTIIEGMLGASINARFGPDVSPRYDLLPLMDKGMRIETGTASGASVFLLSGTSSVQDSTAIISRLHASVRQGGSATERITQKTTDGFLIDAIVPAVAADTVTENRGGWTVSVTGSFRTAIRGDNVIIGNDRRTFEAALSQTATALPVGTVAEGTVGTQTLSMLTLHLAPTMPIGSLFSLLPSSERIDWNLSAANGLWTLSLAPDNR